MNRKSLALVMTLALLAAPALWAAISGAIYTSTGTGTTVNGNVYEAKSDVYLNGGPQNQNAAGLPDGIYFYQVTNPSGSVLLSEDLAICRQLVVSGGVVSGAYADPAADPACHHANGTYDPDNGSTPVQLIPFSDTPNAGGEYKVWLISQALGATINTTDGHYIDFTSNMAKTDNFKVRLDSETPPVAITGAKFYDANANGTWDGSEVGIAGWMISKTPPTPADITFTSTTGAYSYIVLPFSGSYTLAEVFPVENNWLATTATSHVVNVEGSDIAVPAFGNVCLGAGGGRTLGFWSNRNGAALFLADDLAAMNALNLRSANGSHFNPGNYSQFRNWILNATATNMAYMLSAQLAAMRLNVLNGVVSGSALVYAPGVPGANSAGFISINALMSAADSSLGLYGLTLSGHAQRSTQEAMKNALDKANNNLNFVQAEACAFSYPQ